ncbi:MAG: TrmH family RNA methyltransferase, partial [Syntrophobacteraceae bacterium]
MKINLENIAVVLNEPHYPENIGAAVRAAKNMGISRFLVVNPADSTSSSLAPRRSCPRSHTMNKAIWCHRKRHRRRLSAMRHRRHPS